MQRDELLVVCLTLRRQLLDLLLYFNVVLVLLDALLQLQFDLLLHDLLDLGFGLGNELLELLLLLFKLFYFLQRFLYLFLELAVHLLVQLLLDLVLLLLAGPVGGEPHEVADVLL